MDATTLSLLVDAVREVKESITRLSGDVNSQMGQLPSTYVPRQEVRGWIDNLITKAADERADRKAEIAQLKAQLVAIEERRRADRWQFITAVLALAGLGLTALAIVITHWK